MKKLSWKVENCPKCSSVAVKSLDGFWGCLRCRELPPEAEKRRSEGQCVYCGQQLIIMMEACLLCGNQPKDLSYWSKSF